MREPPITIDNTLGVALIGNVFTAILFGVSTGQAYSYWFQWKSDSRLLRWTVAFLWVIGCFHLALITHALYHHLISRFGDLSSFLVPSWSLFLQVMVSAISDLGVRVVLSWRVWRFSNGNILLAVVIAVASLIATGSALGWVGKAFGMSVVQVAALPWTWPVMLTLLVSSVIADALITVPLCIMLRKSCIGKKRLDSILWAMILFSTGTGLFTSIFAVITFICYILMRHNFVFISLAFVISSLNFNALLTNLNMRERFRAELNNPVTIFDGGKDIAKPVCKPEKKGQGKTRFGSARIDVIQPN